MFVLLFVLHECRTKQFPVNVVLFKLLRWTTICSLHIYSFIDLMFIFMKIIKIDKNVLGQKQKVLFQKR